MQPDCLRACSPLRDSPSYCCAAGLMPCAHMDLLSRRRLCSYLAVCVCAPHTLTTLIKAPALQTSLGNRHRMQDERREVFIRQGDRDVIPGCEARIKQWKQVHIMICTNGTKHWGTKPQRLQSIIFYYASVFFLFFIFTEYHY